MTPIEIYYEIITNSAFFVGSGMGIAGMVDKGCIKDYKGFVYFPGSSIKGKVRYFCKQLVQLPLFKTSKTICQTTTHPEICKTDDLCIICQLFGSNFTEGSLQFSDAQLTQDLRMISYETHPMTRSFQSSFRTTNKINRVTGTTETGHLFTSEVGERELLFEGTIEGSIEDVRFDPACLPLELLLIISGLKMVNSLGGQKSRGLGDCSINIQKILVNENECPIAKNLDNERFTEWSIMAEGGQL